jgi:hypothetical protein
MSDRPPPLPLWSSTRKISNKPSMTWMKPTIHWSTGDDDTACDAVAVNHWARRHREHLQSTLEDGEALLAACRVTLVGAIDLARRLGLPAPARLFVLGVTDRRIVLWRTTTWLGAPQTVAGALPLGQVAVMRRTWRIGPRRLSILLESGSTVRVGPMWGGSLRELETAFATARPHV